MGRSLKFVKIKILLLILKRAYCARVDLKIWTSRESPNYVSPFSSKDNLRLRDLKSPFFLFLHNIICSPFFIFSSPSLTAHCRHEPKGGRSSKIFSRFQVRKPHQAAPLWRRVLQCFCSFFGLICLFLWSPPLAASRVLSQAGKRKRPVSLFQVDSFFVSLKSPAVISLEEEKALNFQFSRLVVVCLKPSPLEIRKNHNNLDFFVFLWSPSLTAQAAVASWKGGKALNVSSSSPAVAKTQNEWWHIP